MVDVSGCGAEGSGMEPIIGGKGEGGAEDAHRGQASEKTADKGSFRLSSIFFDP
jgi:hypothetical protein